MSYSQTTFNQTDNILLFHNRTIIDSYVLRYFPSGTHLFRKGKNTIPSFYNSEYLENFSAKHTKTTL